MPFIVKQTVTETFLERVSQTPHEVGFQVRHESGQWEKTTFKQFYDECKLVSFGLMGLGLKKGDRAVILSNTRIEWALADMAILGAQSVTVPIYASNTPEDCVYILNHCEARVAFLEDGKQLQKILDQREQLKFLEKIILINASAMKLAPNRQDVMTFQALKELGRREEARDPSRFEKNLSLASPQDLITICYTSGTTGVPKGAMLTHDNMMSVLEDCLASVKKFVEPEKEVLVSFLPFSHIIGKCESMSVYVFGWRSCFAENIDKLMSNIAEIQPTVMFAVPRIFEKGFNRIQAGVAQSSALKQKLYHWAVDVGRKYFTQIWAKNTPDVQLKIEFALAQKLVLSKIADRFGGKLRFAICGGAPLPKEIGEYFQIAGIKILEGYGLTETCAPIALNVPDAIKFGFVGRPLPEVEIRIAEDGEIIAKSRKIFKGYYKMEAETADVLKGGWLYTGDIGIIDDEGFLKITDRKKDIIITSGGKNVAPQKIENLAKSQKYINQFVVHGDRRNYLTALITLDVDAVSQYAHEHQILFSEFSELIRNPKIIGLIQKQVDEVNSHLASFETIKKFVLLPRELTVDAGEITPSLKVKRGVMNQKYKAELDSMY